MSIVPLSVRKFIRSVGEGCFPCNHLACVHPLRHSGEHKLSVPSFGRECVHSTKYADNVLRMVAPAMPPAMALANSAFVNIVLPSVSFSAAESVPAVLWATGVTVPVDAAFCQRLEFIGVLSLERQRVARQDVKHAIVISWQYPSILKENIARALLTALIRSTAASVIQHLLLSTAEASIGTLCDL